MKVAIIGAGVSGCSIAYFLSKNGVQCRVFEQGLGAASGASGNLMGLYNPRFFADYNAEAKFYARAFLEGLDLFRSAGAAVRHSPVGALHLINTDQKQRRYAKMMDSWGWDERLMQMLSADQASDVAGIDVEYDCLYLPQSGMVSPHLLCRYYLDQSGADLIASHEVKDLATLLSDYDSVIVASGYSALQFKQTRHFPLSPVRGQVSYLSANDQLSPLKCVLCYGGYTTPQFDDMHVIGSTFDRGVSHADMKPSDHQDNLDKLYDAHLAKKGALDPCVTGGRAGVRVSAPGHMPIIGQADDRVYVSLAHGSHGLLSSLMGAQILAAQICGHAMPFNRDVLERLSPDRFSC